MSRLDAACSKRSRVRSEDPIDALMDAAGLRYPIHADCDPASVPACGIVVIGRLCIP